MENRVYGNRYQVTERVGLGGMAEVFKATDSTLGRTVAVKVMLPQYAADKTFAARFRQEAQAAANLTSPYIVNIYDWGKDGDSYYIIMEYVRGVDLKTALQERGSIHPRKVAEIGSQVCSALSVAHSYGIIHRDIKSANIMVQTDGNVKVMDFGIAQAGNSGMTQDSSVLGTAHYVSPEQAQGKHLTGASDLYSLGIVMYEAATGQLPFDGPDAVSVAMKQVTEEPIAPRAINPGIDPTLEAIIMRAMSKDVNYRYASANEMKQALDDYLAGRVSAATTVIGSAAAGASPDATIAMETLPGQGRGQGRTVRNTYDDNDRDNGSGRKGAGEQGKSGKRKPIVLIIILVLVILLGAGIRMVACSSQAEKVAVPNVVDMTLADAKDEITKAGLEVGKIKYEASEDVEKGKVISQSPDAKDTAAEGDEIDLVVSKGKDVEMVDVPKLTGLTAKEAEAELAKKNLSGKASKDYSDDVPKGQVISQDPAAGSSVEEGSTVTYVVSLGKEDSNVTVPSVVGDSESSASNQLQKLGLTVNVSYDYSNDYPSGTVCSQSIASGTKVEEGSSITIVISKGSKTGTIPNTIGMTESAAKAEIKNAGFLVSVSYAEGANGEVIAQDATGDATLGATVHITVGTGTTPSASDYSAG